MTIYKTDHDAPANEIELSVETLEEVIAPALDPNHNETVEDELTVEELEALIAPGLSMNHNETLVG